MSTQQPTSIVKKDPNGLMQRDMAVLYKMFTGKPISPKMTEQEIMFQAGQHSVLAFIEREFMGKRGY
jgi:hypothetical protein